MGLIGNVLWQGSRYVDTIKNMATCSHVQAASQVWLHDFDRKASWDSKPTLKGLHSPSPKNNT